MTSLGAILDRTRWDYAPRDRGRADLLSPAGSLFSAVPWDQADAFDHPTGVVREVWSARFVYWLLGQGSAFGTAFPSSHVAATVAATIALWYQWRRMALVVIVPTVLLIVATVYCQMHYAVDAGSGLLVGIGGGVVGSRAVGR